MSRDRAAALEGLPSLEAVQLAADGSVTRLLVPIAWNMRTCCGDASRPFKDNEVPTQLAERGVTAARWAEFCDALQQANRQRPVGVESVCGFFMMVCCMPTLGLSMCAFNRVRESSCAATWSTNINKAVQKLNTDLARLGIFAKTQSVQDINMRISKSYLSYERNVYADCKITRWVAFAFNQSSISQLQQEDHCFFVPPSGAIVSGHQFEKNARLGCLPNISPSGNQYCLHPWG